jgi:predicted transcriptional regulator
MVLDDSKKSINKLFLHDKPFMLLKVINDSSSPVYAASISKKIDCSYAYIVRLIKVMHNKGIVEFEGNSHKKIINLTPKGKKILKLLSEID